MLTGSVGVGGVNNFADIKNVQKALNQRINSIAPTAKLVEDGKLGSKPENSKTVAAIKVFQKKVVGLISPDGLIDKNGRTHKKLNAAPVAVPATNSDTLTFPGTNFTYGRTKKTVAECLATLPTEMRADFKSDISKIIKEMHKLGIAFGTIKRHKAGYRTFQDQFSIPATATKAGPGESFHNYGLAADLGVLDWVDNKGKSHSDFWLGTMDSMAGYKGLSAKIWAKRNSFASSKVHSLSWEIIHLQGVPARTSGRASLVKCLNEAAKLTDFSYQKGSGKIYQCKTSKTGSWVNIGTAKELWLGTTIKNVTPADKSIIVSHMIKAESIAKTIKL